MTTKTNNNHNHKTNTNTEVEKSEFELAFEKTKVERDALGAADLVPINVDLKVVLPMIFTAVPRIAALRAAAKELPDFDVAQFDLVPTYAMALGQAQADFLRASESNSEIRALVERATALREILLAGATALASCELLDGKPLADLKGGPGYMNIASDLSVLAGMFRDRWDSIQSKTAVSAAHLNEAQQLFEQITMTSGDRSQQSANVTAATEQRTRAFTLLVNAYDEARRAVYFLRWKHGDAEKIAPSIYAGRGGGRPSKDNGTQDTQPVDPPNGNAPVVVTPPVANGSTSPANGAPVEAGHPGGSPFAS